MIQESTKMRTKSSLRKRVVAFASTVVLATASVAMTVVVAPAAAADRSVGLSPVLSPSEDQVTADALPTVQVDGMVWSQAVIGTTVYAGGKFANARPAGAAVGTQQTPRANLLAYDVTTGALKTSFAPPALNGQVLAVAASPDGKRIYAAGDFTNVDGSTVRNRVAAFDATTGALITTFNVNIASRVKSIVATNETVYVGGQFTSANGQPRTRLAAYAASNGALAAWAPTADYTVNAMVLSPDKSKLIVGGAFQSINGSAAYGLAAIDARTGDPLPFAANQSVQNSGANAAINSLSTDGTSIYGTGYVYGPGGNLEGTFSADPSTGVINWLEDCHGDTYSAWATSAAVYTVSHAHYCGNIGGFFQSDPWSTNQRFALAFSKNVTGTIGADPYGYHNWQGSPSPSLLNWFPDFKTGSVSGQNQAGWNVIGTGQFVSVAGEFPSVNGVAQQGLVRFATKPTAPAKSGPMLTGSKFMPSLVSLSAGSVRVGFQANWDRDDKTLTYKVVRNSNTAAPVYTVTADSTYWDRPFLGFTDTNIKPGDYRYRLYVLDKDGNQVAGDTATVTVPADAPALSAYAAKVTEQGAATFWRLGESSGTTAYDWAGYSDGVVGAGVTRGAAGAINGDPNMASTFNGSTDSRVSSPASSVSPDVFTTEAWIKTTSTSGGKIIGFGNSQTDWSSSYDRHLFMLNDGRISFGVYRDGTRQVTSGKSYNDGQWHQVVSTMGTDGMNLYVDGIRVGQRTDTTSGNPYTGYWRVGGDNLNGWNDAPANHFFTGAIDDVSIYPTVLTGDQVIDQYVTSGRTSPIPAAPADSYGAAVYRDQPTLFWRLGERTGTTAADSGRQLNSGTYRGGVTLGAPGAISGLSDTSAMFDGNSGYVTSDSQFSNPTTYSEEAWFKTTTQSGGKLIGFGSSQQGLSGGYDRHVYMQDNGQLVFGAWTGSANVVASPNAYNDGQWHQVVATQGADGMKLYVDGTLIGTNPQTGSQNYDGYWRIGGDSTWGSSSAYFAGSLDDVAVYSAVLSADQVSQHYSLGATGALPNKAPTAAFAATPTNLSVAVDGSASSDPDGSVMSYAWDFGDGANASGAAANHTYGSAGTFTVALTVTDDRGATNTVSKTVTVTAPPANTPPTASFTTGGEGLTLSVDGRGSTDADGTIASYTWSLGDGTTTSGPTANHTYLSGGTFTVTLTVTDDKGSIGTSSQTVTVTAPPPNAAPTASFTVTSAGLTATVDGTASTDPDGSIQSYAWSFGDGASDSGAAAVHTYASAGTFTISLTVTDDDGATNTVSKSAIVTAPPPANNAPTASFSSTVSGLAVVLDGGGSSDPDGFISSWSWDFGDGAADTGRSANHTYGSAGTFTVALTVTDDQGATGTVSKTVTVTAPGTPTVFAADSFGRSVVNGLGSAGTGGAWMLNGTASLFSVANGTANLRATAAGSGPSAWLNSVSAADVRGAVDFTYDKASTGGGTYTSAVVRRVGTSDYRFKVRIQPTSVQVQVSKVVNGVETVLQTKTLSGMTWAPGDVLRLAFQAQGMGSTALSAKVWKVGSAEPGSWQATVTDGEPGLQGVGAVGLQAYLAGSATNAPVVASFDNLTITTIPN